MEGDCAAGHLGGRCVAENGEVGEEKNVEEGGEGGGCEAVVVELWERGGAHVGDVLGGWDGLR